MEDLDKIPDRERRRWPQFFEVIIRVNNKREFQECSGLVFPPSMGERALPLALHAL